MVGEEGVTGDKEGKGYPAELDPLNDALSAIKTLPADISKGISAGPIGLMVTGIAKIGESMVEMLTKIMQLVIESSPYLQGVLKIIDKMFKLVLMPIGNMIAKLLLPLAIKMANKTIAVMEKYANAGPEEMGQAAADSFSVITESLIEMAAVILVKALAPMFTGMVTGIVNGIGQFFGGGGGTVDYMSGLKSATDDLTSIMGKSAVGTSSVIDQFGLTVSTGNKAVGTSTSELATVMYHGADSIEDGFQSSTTAIAIGSTKALGFLDQYNIANAGMLTVIDTTTTTFDSLNESLNVFKTQMNQTTNNAQNNNVGTTTTTSKGWDWWQWGLAIGAVAAAPFTGGLSLAGLAGYEIATQDNPFGNSKTTQAKASGGTPSNINFYGNIYDKTDITQMINKANTAKLRGSY